ncbi:MAG: SDR family NAD(P)-dependent oxidoreductase [Clostridia bacterium]|nr:SDR family NAD(P)-dependent oxidoreductase [Clostridia bacterium]
MALSKKTKKWIRKNCPPSLAGKTVLITGANSGVGFKSAEEAVYLGAKVIMACRNTEKADAARDELLREYGGAEIEIMPLDLASFSSIEAFAARLESERTDIDVFLNNAGVFHKPNSRTADGFELVTGTNYLGAFRLCEEVLPYLATLPHKVIYINTVSIIHKIAKIDYGDFFHKKNYKNLSVYAASKLCLARYTFYKARALEGGNVSLVMSHPGIAITPLGINAYGETVGRLAKMFGGIFNSPEKSALSLLYIISNEPPAGTLAGPDRLFGGWGYPRQNRVYKKVKTGGKELADFTKKLLK